MSEDRLRTYIDEVLELIRDHGWAVQGVFGDPEGDLAYTVGLAGEGRPELVATGPAGSVRSLHGMLNELAPRRLAAGEVARYQGAGGVEVEVRLREVDPSPLAVARAIAPRARALQVVWPDPAGRFPGEPGFDDRFDQRMLEEVGS